MYWAEAGRRAQNCEARLGRFRGPVVGGPTDVKLQRRDGEHRGADGQGCQQGYAESLHFLVLAFMNSLEFHFICVNLKHVLCHTFGNVWSIRRNTLQVNMVSWLKYQD